MAYWLLKTEPEDFSYDDLVAKGREPWNGVRGVHALRNMARIIRDDGLFIYHTGKSKSIVGVGRALTDPYPDPSESDPKLILFDVGPLYALVRPVTLAEVKAEEALGDWALAKCPRLSVMPVGEGQWRWVHEVSGTVPLI